jgi:hypothetical protein
MKKDYAATAKAPPLSGQAIGTPVKKWRFHRVDAGIFCK